MSVNDSFLLHYKKGEVFFSSVDFVYSASRPRTNFEIAAHLRKKTFLMRNALFAVYEEIGHAFAAPICKECLEMELALQDIPHDAQRQILLPSHGRNLRHALAWDVIC